MLGIFEDSSRSRTKQLFGPHFLELYCPHLFVRLKLKGRSEYRFYRSINMLVGLLLLNRATASQ